MIKLLGKRLEPETMPVLYDTPITEDSFLRDFEVRDGKWWVEDGWLIGENPNMSAAITLLKESFYGPVFLDFYAKVLPPSTHDINCMWSGSWDETHNRRGLAYVAGLGGFWDRKVGFEKSDAYKLVAATKLMDFEADHVYHMQCGSIGGHVFVLVDGVVALEIRDPEPIDQMKNGRVGFEAFSTRVAYRDLKILRADYTPAKETYEKEF
jgi:hypothetical protein